MPNVSELDIEQSRIALAEEVAETQRQLDDALLEAACGADTGQVEQLQGRLAELADRGRNLDGAARAAARRVMEERETKQRERVAAGVEQVTQSVAEFQLLLGHLQQAAHEMADLIARIRAAEMSAWRTAISIAGPGIRDSLGDSPSLLINSEIAALLMAVQRGAVGEANIHTMPASRAGRLLQSVRADCGAST